MLLDEQNTDSNVGGRDEMQPRVMLHEHLRFVGRVSVVVHVYRQFDLLFLAQGQSVRLAIFSCE